MGEDRREACSHRAALRRPGEKAVHYAGHLWSGQQAHADFGHFPRHGEADLAGGEGCVPQERGRVLPGECVDGPEVLHGVGSEVLPQKLDAGAEPSTPREVNSSHGQLATADDGCVQGVSFGALQHARLVFSGQQHG